ncbi:hypothetical protein GCM10012275_38520 [Longimycelium tulufanense]|uniref:Uncharacterized protein n=2 Tax=Longimycelium tulufanense TaxID=907463 RepID=A0A8J3FVJ9_9PSEU|nr:hypothetical protein GCM10012275_38520 [Longimycelium tulufanense]
MPFVTAVTAVVPAEQDRALNVIEPAPCVVCHRPGRRVVTRDWLLCLPCGHHRLLAPLHPTPLPQQLSERKRCRDCA